MEPAKKKSEMIASLQAQILKLQGFKPVTSACDDLGLGAMRGSFPSGSFPLGVVHEFLPGPGEDKAPVSGFISGVVSGLLQKNGAALWITPDRRIFPPALRLFGIQPERILFLTFRKNKDALWAMEEALKCPALTAVVGELPELDFTSSRRLQLAVEESSVTGFIVRHSTAENTTACVSRWRISSLPGEPAGDLPGIGFPKWRVELLRMRNGRPGTWDVSWKHGAFHFAGAGVAIKEWSQLRAG